MAFDHLLTAGAITQILDNQRPANPILQIIGYKPMTPDQMAFGTVTDELRYRLMIGDGLNAHQYCVITNQDLVEDIKCGRLEKWSLIKVTSYQTVDYGEGPPDNKRRLIYILNLEVVKKGSEIGHKITCNPANTNNQPQQQQQQHQPQVMQPSRNNPNFNKPYDNNQQQFARPQVNSYNSSSYAQPTQPQPYPGNGGGMQPDLIRSPRSTRGYEQQTIGIGELTPYIGRWVVKGRVTSKSAIREYNNAKGGGKLFNFVLADKTGEIKITAFNADCERVYGYVEPNKVYLLGRATVKNADKRYTTSDHEITLNNDSLLEEVIDAKEASDVPMAKYNFVSIGSIPNLQPNQPADLIGAISEVTDVSTILSKTKNKELKKRNITIVDMSRHSISVTIWGDQADTFHGVEGDIFVTKGARIGNYGGCSASAGDCLFVNPDIPEVRKVRAWYSNLLDRNFKPLTNPQEIGGGGDQWRTIEQLLNIEAAKQALSAGQAGVYGKCKAILMSVGRNPVYKCCPTDGCGKKLEDTQNGELKCTKCQQTYSNFKYRFKADVELCDCSTSTYTTLWDEKAEAILGMKPEELELYMRKDNKDAYEKILTKPNFKAFIFTFRARLETYNQEERVKVHVINMVALDAVTFSKRLIDEIKGFAAS